MSTPAVGIDLGTTFSAIAHVNKHGVPEILHNAEGERITPSVILFDNEEIIVGNYAEQAAVAFPEQVVQFVKRHIGQPDYQFTYNGRTYNPEELSSYILAKLKSDAELRLGQKVEHAVITVPAYFTDLERRATIAAGKRAGLNVLKLINEPTAAAFAYGLANAGRDLRVLVFDLGGGTFDVTIVDINKREVAAIATAGDSKLGGKDWDDALVKHAAAQFYEKHGVNPLDDIVARHDLRQKCVSAKLSLSRRPRVNLFYDYHGQVIRLNITRDDFEQLASPLVQRCEQITLRVLEEAGLVPGDIDTVLLAGGSTRMPMVRDMIARIFGKDAATDINPDECVSLGAAVTAALESAEKMGTAPPVDIRTHDVTSHSLGMVVYQEGVLKTSLVIPRNSRIPCEQTRSDYVTTHDGQESMDLWLVQGENPDPLRCHVLGHFEFIGIPKRPAGESPLSVTFRYNSNGIVEVEAKDVTEGRVLSHQMAAGHMTLEDIARNRVPMQIALVMDCSGSMYGTSIREARKAAKTFVNRTLQRNREVAVIAFPGGVKTAATNQIDRIEAAIDSLTPIGSTPMHEGLSRARDLLKNTGNLQRVVLILADGHPDDPEAAAAEAHRIKADRGRIIVVGIGRQVDRTYLQRLCSTPSDYHHVDENIDLEGTFINLATQLAPKTQDSP